MLFLICGMLLYLTLVFVCFGTKRTRLKFINGADRVFVVRVFTFSGRGPWFSSWPRRNFSFFLLSGNCVPMNRSVDAVKMQFYVLLISIRENSKEIEAIKLVLYTPRNYKVRYCR